MPALTFDHLDQLCSERDSLRWEPRVDSDSDSDLYPTSPISVHVGMRSGEPAIAHRYAGWCNEKEGNAVRLCRTRADLPDRECTTHVLNVGSTGGDAVKPFGSAESVRLPSAVRLGVEGWAHVEGLYVSSAVSTKAPYFSCSVSDHPPMASRASGPPPSLTPTFPTHTGSAIGPTTPTATSPTRTSPGFGPTGTTSAPTDTSPIRTAGFGPTAPAVL